MVDDELGFDLFAYLRMLWRHKWIILIAVTIAVAGTLGIETKRARIYQGTATILFVSQNYTAPGEVAPLQPSDVLTDIELVQGASVYFYAVKALGEPAPRAIVSEIGTTDTATIQVTSPSATFAARAANAYANAYITESRNQYLQTQQGVESQLQNQISALQTQITGVESQIASATGPALTSLNAQLGTIESELQTHQTQLSQVQTNVAQTPSSGRMVIAATIDLSPVSPQPIRDALVFGLLGLVLGIALAFLRERTDDRLRSKEALEEVSEGLPTLGLIPKVDEWHDQRTAFLVEALRPDSPPAEAYRGLRTSIQFLGFDGSLKTLQITSPVAVEGKTTTAANLAVAMAQTGNRVVLVSCDLRRPRIHEFFGLSNDIGFTSVVVGDATLEDALLRVPGYESLHLLPSGPIPPNPSELLGNARATEIFRTLAQNADLVIVDSPPVMPVTDASVLATSVDGVLVVVVAGSTTRKDVRRALETLGRVGARVVGMVLNKAPEADSYGYYRYGYSAKSSKAPPQEVLLSHTNQNGSSNGSDPERIQTRRERRSG